MQAKSVLQEGIGSSCQIASCQTENRNCEIDSSCDRDDGDDDGGGKDSDDVNNGDNQ